MSAAPPVLTQKKIGTSELAHAPVIGNCYGFSASIDVSQNLDPNVSVSVDIYASTDGGLTWQYAGGMSGVKGPCTDSQGMISNAATISSFVLRGDGQSNNLPGWMSPLVKTVTKVSGADAIISDPVVTPLLNGPPIVDAHHSISVVQSVQASASAANTCSTAGITTTSGNLIVTPLAFYNVNGFTSVTGTIGGSADGNTYGAVCAVNQNLDTHAHRAASNITGGASHVFTLTLNGAPASGFPTLHVIEISGCTTSSPLDQTGTAFDGSGATSHPVTTGGATTTANEIVVGSMGCGGAGYTFGQDGGYANAQNTAPSSVTGMISGTKIISATGSQTYTPTTSSSQTGCQCISTYTAAAGGSVVPQIMFNRQQAA